MDVPLADFNALDLERELYARGLDTEGTKQERSERLVEACQSAAAIPWRPRRASIAKFGASVQLENFTEIRNSTNAECDVLSGKLHWRVEHVRRTEDGEGLEYFHADALTGVDPSKTYMLNIDEYMVRQEPYVHKIFVVFVSRTDGTEMKLCYARSLAKLRCWDETVERFEFSILTSDNMFSNDAECGVLQATLMTPEQLVKAMSYILTELRNKGLNNYVAIVCDEHRLGLTVAAPLIRELGLELPTIIWDIRDLQKTFRIMFCSACVHCTMRVNCQQYTKASYDQQLAAICNSSNTKNLNAMIVLMDQVNRLPDIMHSMWNCEEHRDKPISLAGMNNRLLKIYGKHVKRELPPITYEDCAAGAGLLQLLVFDALWCLSMEREPEEATVRGTTTLLYEPVQDN
ncbi:hypothetical protein KR222_008511 [Zaprionus bogoriensis]|nr:hypothetical protein KR222_008511 [Zaprionus bogoriensis]